MQQNWIMEFSKLLTLKVMIMINMKHNKDTMWSILTIEVTNNKIVNRMNSKYKEIISWILIKGSQITYKD